MKMNGQHGITLILRRCGTIWTQCDKHLNLICHGIRRDKCQRTFSMLPSHDVAFPVPNIAFVNTSATLLKGRKRSVQLLQTKYTFQDCCTKLFVTVAQLKEEQPLMHSRNTATSTKNRVKYLCHGKGVAEPVFTDKFDSCTDFLTSLDIATDELEYYPDIQEMEEADIVASVDKLKEKHIHVVFSLFLIQRIFMEISLERAAKDTVQNPKYWYKLRNGKYKLTSIRCMVFYLELCKLLERPNLDPIKLANDLAAIGIYDQVETLTKKTRKLVSVGATPEDILNNLMLYRGTEWFDSKIKLYQVAFGKGVRPFPVKLFLSSTLTEFKDKLNVGREVTEISKLLNIKDEDFLTCWGLMTIDTKSLVYKVHMCLKAGIPQMDIFNSIDILSRISEDQCHRVTSSLCKSGQPGSVYVFKTLERNIRLRTVNGNRHNTEEPDWTDEPDDDTDATSLFVECPRGDDGSKKSTSNTAAQIKDKTSKDRDSEEALLPPTPSNYKFPESSKVWRRAVFKLISRLLHLDKPCKKAMYKADINIDPTQLVDVTRNLGFLVTQGFTKEEIRQCPIVLAHPHKHVVRVKNDLENLLNESFTSLPFPSSSAILPSSSSTIFHPRMLLSDPVCHLNVLQYFLEKETNFSLSYSHTQSVVGFVN